MFFYVGFTAEGSAGMSRAHHGHRARYFHNFFFLFFSSFYPQHQHTNTAVCELAHGVVGETSPGSRTGVALIQRLSPPRRCDQGLPGEVFLFFIAVFFHQLPFSSNRHPPTHPQALQVTLASRESHSPPRSVHPIRAINICWVTSRTLLFGTRCVVRCVSLSLSLSFFFKKKNKPAM